MPEVPSARGSQRFHQEFPGQLQEALIAIDIPSEREWRVPGTQSEIDLYLPSLPRVAVEIKLWASQEALARALGQAEAMTAALRSELGPTFRTLLLLVCPPGHGPDPLPAVPDGVTLLVLEREPSPEDTAKAAADRIQHSLARDRELVFGAGLVTIGVTSAMAGSAAATMLGLSVPLLGPIGLLVGGGLLLSRFVARHMGEESPAPGPGAEQAKPEPVPSAPAPARFSTPPGEADVLAISNQASGILVAFRDLAPESCLALGHEMDFLVEEFRQGHHTACALRGGRCLEFMIYELSRLWHIELQDATFGQIQDLRGRLDRVSDLMGDYQNSTGGERARLGEVINAALAEMSAKTVALMLVDKDRQTAGEPKEELGTRTVAALLKKIRNRYAGLPGVADSINAILDKGANTPEGSLIKRVARTRNHAAHADVHGRNQEANESSIRQFLEDINVLMLKLSNVGIAIRASQKPG